VVAAVAGLATRQWRVSRAAPSVHYVTAAVTRGPVVRAVTATGSVNQVGTYVSGVIQQLYCDYNTLVRKGQLCARIDPRPYQTVVEQTRANLSTAKAQLTKDQTNLEYAKLTYDRHTALRAGGLVSQDTLDAAKSAFHQAAAQVELDTAEIAQRQAALNAAQINLAYTDIVSPVNGTVVSRNVTMGQTVAASFQTPTLFLIATDLTNMQVDANVSEGDIGRVAVGNDATFTVESFPQHVFTGTVTQVRQAPQSVQNVITYDVVISVRNEDLLLKPGMTATVRIVTDRRDSVLRVPDQALRYAPGGQPSSRGRNRLWVLRNGQLTAVSVTVGLDDDTYAEVQGDLQEGDEVVTSEQTDSGTGTSRLPFFRL
jgi:HlyD family secretion protein